jgi:mannose-6-phosphate isomerase class I
VPGGHQVWQGAEAWREVDRHARNGRARTPLVVVDTYPGVDLAGLIAVIRTALPQYVVINVEDAAARPIREIDTMIAANLTHDRVFGVISHHSLDQFYDSDRLDSIADRVLDANTPTMLVGWGAALVPVRRSTLVLADLARWEIQQRQRRGAPNWRCDNGDEDNLRKVKRGFFVEWRVADRHKRRLFAAMDFVLDTNAGPDGKLITADTFRAGMAATVSSPFRVVPFFDPGPWGGQWMKRVCGLDDGCENYAWCFDCVPEENSLLLDVAGELVELPSIDVVFTCPQELLGPLNFARFGAEFPIRFDFLDTMEGGNLSLQVHPLTDYITDTFGMHYTQDESYYLLDAADDAVVYLGLKTGIDPVAMVTSLRSASRGELSFPAEEFVNTFPARKHDHFSIPAGTVHCSGADSMVLEISATPYLFTFKMWDWDRVGLDGVPRPIHLEHARRNIQWDRDTAWTRDNLVGQVETLGSGPGWVEERTGLHALEFIDVRRHWFTDAVEHDTCGTVNVLNLVDGAEAVVESPTDSFPPFVVHYAETFIVPAQVGRYSIRPHGPGVGTRLATIKALVRGTEA